MTRRPDITGAHQVGIDPETGRPVFRPTYREYDASPITEDEVAAWGLDGAPRPGEDLRSCADCGAEYDALTFPQGHPCEH